MFIEVEKSLFPYHTAATEGIVMVTAGLKPANLSQKVLICMLSHEPLAGMLPDLHVYIIGAD